MPWKIEWRPFAHIAIDHQLLIAFEQWKASKHRLLWVAVVNRNVGKRDPPERSRRVAFVASNAKIRLKDYYFWERVKDMVYHERLITKDSMRGEETYVNQALRT